MMKLSLLLVLAAATTTYARQQQQQWMDPRHEQLYDVIPSDQTAFLGSKVTLPCRTTKLEPRVQWTQDGFGMGFGRGMQDWSERFRMVGKDACESSRFV